MSIHHIKDVAEGSAGVIKNLPPLAEPKNPVNAFMAGLIFEALGVAIYFKSAKDFVICFGLFIVASNMLPGLGSMLGWFFAPCFGADRAVSSNESWGL